MPAYNAAKTLRQTYEDIPHGIVDDVILVDDASRDETVSIAAELGIKTFIHRRNSGYGANQKTCYRQALEMGADIIVMLHPDYQYTPKLITAMAAMIASGLYPVVLGSRVLGHGALAGGMPLYKYVSNRILTLIQNLCLGQKLTEYHTGYRSFSREILLYLPLGENSDDFVFDNEMLAQLMYFGYEIAEITCPAKYFSGASSINFRRSVRYGLGVLATTVKYLRAKAGASIGLFNSNGRKLYDELTEMTQEASEANVSVSALSK